MTDDAYKVAFAPVTQQKLPPGDPRWPTFNGSFRNVEMPAVNVAAMLYDGHPITVQLKAPWRTTANYLYGQHLGIDFDTEDQRSTLTTLQKDPFISRYGSILYTTPSHTPDKPRARAIFLVDIPIHHAANYTLAASALLWVFGSADRQCKDAVRFFYGGRPGACEMEFIGNVLPQAIIKDMIRRYQATGRREHKRIMATSYSAPNQQRVADALGHIDPWAIEYDQWLSILMAIHSEFPGDDGLSMADSWAQGKGNEVEQKWRSFQPAGNTAGRVGIGTLFAIAREKGWQASA